MRRLFLVLLVGFAIGLFGCGSDGGDGDGGGGGGGGSTSVEEVCDKVFECFDNNWGWDTQENCEAMFMHNCKSESGYMGCTAACVAGACSAFDGCEPDCWTKHCD